MTELLKCPYCGSEVKVYENFKHKFTWECRSYECSVGSDRYFKTKQEAIDHANRRAE